MPRKTKTVFPMEQFLQRLELLWQEQGLSRAEFERRLGIKNTWRWGKIVKSIELDTLLLISQKFHKSLDWLLGRVPASLLPEPAILRDLPAAPYVAQPLELNESLLAATVGKIKEYLHQEHKKLTPAQEALLVARIYADCAEHHQKPSLTQVHRNLLFAERMQQE